VKTFKLVRDEDVSGVSGTGVVAEGVQFDDGQCVLWWPNFGTIGMYSSAGVLEAVHGHEGRTRIEYDSAGQSLPWIPSGIEPVAVKNEQE
jgi:hypothetical protein